MLCKQKHYPQLLNIKSLAKHKVPGYACRISKVINPCVRLPWPPERISHTSCKHFFRCSGTVHGLLLPAPVLRLLWDRHMQVRGQDKNLPFSLRKITCLSHCYPPARDSSTDYIYFTGTFLRLLRCKPCLQFPVYLPAQSFCSVACKRDYLWNLEEPSEMSVKTPVSSKIQTLQSTWDKFWSFPLDRESLKIV